MEGLVFNRPVAGKEEEHIIRSLEILHAISAVNNGGNYEASSGWCKVEVSATASQPQPQVLLIPEKHLAAYIESGTVAYDSNSKSFSLYAPYVNYLVRQPMNTDVEAGTVLLSSGTLGVYEMHKEEILSYLIRGMNVMAFNYRGYGESKGAPTKEGTYKDIEAAYQYLKNVQHVDDKDLIVKGACLGGAPSAHLASQHPQVNLLLDKVVADFPEMVKHAFQVRIDEFVEKCQEAKQFKQTLLAWAVKHSAFLSKAAVKMVVPNYHVYRDIQKVEGNVGVVFAVEDEVVRRTDLDLLIQSRFKKGKKIDIISLPGVHNDVWYHAKGFELPEDANQIAKVSSAWKNWLGINQAGVEQMDRLLDKWNLKNDLI